MGAGRGLACVFWFCFVSNNSPTENKVMKITGQTLVKHEPERFRVE